MNHQLPNGAPLLPLHNSAPIQPLFPDLGFPQQHQNKVVRGTGTLSWLSSKAGLIQCTSMNSTVSFQLKDFCDQGVNDFISVLRPGFRLAFQAVVNDASNEWIANYVAPLPESEPSDDKEINLEEFEKKLSSDIRHASSKDHYSLELEIKALSFLLSVFQKNGTHNISLSSLHSRISNSGCDDLYRYVGSSSLKRRQFIERRSYVFHVTENDQVYLQPAEVYTTVLMLASYLLRRGGATPSDMLFTFFNSDHRIPQSVRETVQNSRVKFVELLAAHPFVFSVFPSQYYVSVRRNLPYFEYACFVKKNFPNCTYPIRINGGAMQYPPNGVNNFAGFEQPAASDQMTLAQYGINGGHMNNYQNMFQEDTPVVTPRNPWTAIDTPPTPILPAQPPARPNTVLPAQSPFENVGIVPNMFMNGGGAGGPPNATGAPPPAAAMKIPPPQPLNATAPKPNHPGVIGDRSMSRHNSVSTTGGGGGGGSVGSNLYDMMMGGRGLPTPGPYTPTATDPRFSCSPPLSATSSVHQSKAASTTNGANGGGGHRAHMSDMATQTDDNSHLDFSRRIGSQPNCRCVCTCNMEHLIKIFNGPNLE